ncbi:autotransporter outer membrane beta-barrel domain-containing protein [Pantoea sp. 18069]|uniref:autotransporter family protein n=1 Tax=Pantoea sp. 18069 TaxID=2681415 RepID=UPI00190F19DF|nr:autotransporter outer membrane beta-barrel domain-containing protein [Pantoea sp. 18069]
MDFLTAMARRRAVIEDEEDAPEAEKQPPMQSREDRQKAQQVLANLLERGPSRDMAKPPAAPPIAPEVQEGSLTVPQPGTTAAAPELQAPPSAARPLVMQPSPAPVVSGPPADIDAAMPVQALPKPWPLPPHAAALPQDLMPSAMPLAADADGAEIPAPAAAPAPLPKPAPAVLTLVPQPEAMLPELPPIAAAAPRRPAATAVAPSVPEPSAPAAQRKRPADLTIDTDTRYEFDGKMGRAPKLIKRGVGTLVLNHAGEMRNGVHLKQGRIELGHAQGLGEGSLLMDDGSAIDLALDGMTVANDLHMTGSDDPEINTGSNHQVWAGAISGAGFLSKQGAGSLTLTSAANNYTGATDVAQGTLQAGATNTFSAASVHSVATDAALSLAGFDQTIAGLNNRGMVQFSAASAAPGTVLTVTGPYVGHGGELAVAANASASDRLLLSGAAAVASGNTTVRVTNVGDLGEKTTDAGIAIIATENGARLEPGAFALAGGHVDAGAYEYRLHQTDEGASLQSSYRAEVPLISALPAQLRQADMGMLGDMHQRLGDAPSGAGNDRRAWGRMLRTDPGIRQQGSVNPQSSGHLTGFQTGLDLYAAKNVHAGFYLGQLKGDTGVKGLASGVADKYVGFNRLQGRYLGLYASWLGDGGLYADTVLQWADYRNHLHTQESHAATKGRSRLASLETGRPFAIDSRWQIEPQAQLVYRRISLHDTALSHATVQHKTPSDWTLRLGARLKGSFTTRAGVLQPYGSVNVYRSSSTSDVARFVVPAATTDIHTRGGHTSTALAAGATLQLNQRTSFYGELSRHWANGGQARVKSGVQATAGVKLHW